MTGPRVVECAGCDGEGELCHADGGYDPHDGSPTGWRERCPYCGGTGGEEIDDQPITLEDLVEIAGEGECLP